MGMVAANCVNPTKATEAYTDQIILQFPKSDSIYVVTRWNYYVYDIIYIYIYINISNLTLLKNISGDTKT